MLPIARVATLAAPKGGRPAALEAKPKYVVSSTRTDFGWTNGHHVAGDLPTSVQKLKGVTPAACSSVAASSRPSWTGWI
jgi:hypothetical protein